ncbi:MAG: transcriptional repressor, partial [Lachnospiraceae bacterium]|nr:transcriptional repressor [Lachnospiraceae bacterium]
MAGVKFSRQRQAIIDYLCSTMEHPTAETVYTTVRINYPTVSLGTVYRNLNLLADEGEILRLTCGDGSDRFDGNPKPHYHFLCNNCGRVLDLVMEPMNHIDVLAAAGFNGTIEGHTV